MHALTFQQRPFQRKTLAARQKALRRQFVWKFLAVTALCVSGAIWTVSTERTAKARVRPMTSPKTVSMVVAPVTVGAAPESAEAVELQRLQTRNRRLEALVSVLRARSENSR